MHALRAFYCHEPFYAKINLGQDDKNLFLNVIYYCLLKDMLLIK